MSYFFTFFSTRGLNLHQSLCLQLHFRFDASYDPRGRSQRGSEKSSFWGRAKRRCNRSLRRLGRRRFRSLQGRQVCIVIPHGICESSNKHRTAVFLPVYTRRSDVKYVLIFRSSCAQSIHVRIFFSRLSICLILLHCKQYIILYISKIRIEFQKHMF